MGRITGSVIFGGFYAGLIQGLSLVLPGRERIKALAYATERLAPLATIETPRGPIRFSCQTRAAARMPLSFFYLEPETKFWLDRFIQPGETLWDIGANIGHFSLYAAKARQARVVAFEPSAQTFGLLYRNIALNGLGESVAGFGLALSDKTQLARFYLTDASAGTAMHGLGGAKNVLGSFNARFVQNVIAYRGDDFRAQFALAQPDHLKIDVDGTEREILDGLVQTLQRVKTVLIECDGAQEAQVTRDVEARLSAAGLVEDVSIRQQGGWNRLFVRPQ